MSAVGFGTRDRTQGLGQTAEQTIIWVCDLFGTNSKRFVREQTANSFDDSPQPPSVFNWPAHSRRIVKARVLRHAIARRIRRNLHGVKGPRSVATWTSRSVLRSWAVATCTDALLDVAYRASTSLGDVGPRRGQCQGNVWGATKLSLVLPCGLFRRLDSQGRYPASHSNMC